MKLIFLDIDGVLNHDLFYKEKSQDDRYKEVGYPDCDIDPKKIKLLNKLIKDTGAKVVISSTWKKSSTWRKGRTVEILQDILDRNGFKGKIIGLTPCLYLEKNFMPRGIEIYSYLKDNQKHNTRYVIFDDDSDMMLWQKDNFFLVDNYCGLTPNIIYKATRFLNK